MSNAPTNDDAAAVARLREARTKIKKELANRHPYHQWVAENRVSLNSIPKKLDVPYNRATLTRRQKTFGITEEDIQLVIRPMTSEAKDPVFSMGDDTPLSVLSKKPRPKTSNFLLFVSS